MEDILVTRELKKYYGEGNTLTKALGGRSSSRSWEAREHEAAAESANRMVSAP